MDPIWYSASLPQRGNYPYSFVPSRIVITEHHAFTDYNVVKLKLNSQKDSYELNIRAVHAKSLVTLRGPYRRETLQ